MADREESLRLLASAERDFRALRGMTDATIFAEEVFGFHAQQTAEKSLKAWLAFLGEVYPRTHDLSLLLARLDEQGQQVADLDFLLDLNPFAVQFRYDAFEELGAPLNRPEVIAALALVLARVRTQLHPPGDVSDVR